MKGVILLRRVVDFVRVVGEGMDPRGSFEHNELDALITAFGSVRADHLRAEAVLVVC